MSLCQRCPHDGGYCHHTCDSVCFRATGGGSLSKPYPGFPLKGKVPVSGLHAFLVEVQATANLPRDLLAECKELIYNEARNRANKD